MLYVIYDLHYLWYIIYIFYIAYYLRDIFLHIYLHFLILHIYIYTYTQACYQCTFTYFTLFLVSTCSTLCFPGAIFEFFDGLPDMHVLIPKWVMEDLAIDERLWCARGYPVALLMHQVVFFNYRPWFTVRMPMVAKYWLRETYPILNLKREQFPFSGHSWSLRVHF